MVVCCRIRTEQNGGAWCPRPQVGRDATEWLEIDLGELKVISLVETQGRFGNGQVCIMCTCCVLFGCSTGFITLAI